MGDPFGANDIDFPLNAFLQYCVDHGMILIQSFNAPGTYDCADAVKYVTEFDNDQFRRVLKKKALYQKAVKSNNEGFLNPFAWTNEMPIENLSTDLRGINAILSNTSIRAIAEEDALWLEAAAKKQQEIEEAKARDEYYGDDDDYVTSSDDDDNKPKKKKKSRGCHCPSPLTILCFMIGIRKKKIPPPPPPRDPVVVAKEKLLALRAKVKSMRAANSDLEAEIVELRRQVEEARGELPDLEGKLMHKDDEAEDLYTKGGFHAGEGFDNFTEARILVRQMQMSSREQDRGTMLDLLSDAESRSDITSVTGQQI